MDVAAFVQENKRWLVGTGLGAVAWLIGSAIVGSIYDAEGSRREHVNLLRQAGNTPLYDGAALSAAQAESEALAAETQRLQQELAFVRSPKYELAGHGPADQYLFQVGRTLKQGVLQSANERDVQIVDKDVAWDIPAGVDEIRGVLFGLELLDEFAQRLFAAHDAVRAAEPDALAVRAIQALKVEPRRSQRASGRALRPGEVDLRDLVEQERIQVQFQADEATCARMLEACRLPGRTLVVESWQLQQPTRLGEPCTVKATLQGISFKPAQPQGEQ